MALIRFQIGSSTVGLIRNPKCGSTTAMSYVAQALWDDSPIELQNKSRFETYLGEGCYIGRAHGFENYQKELKECDIRIAIYREPIAKFLSGWYHSMFKISGSLNRCRWGPHTLDDFLDHYDHYMQDENIRTHCRSNTSLLGASKEIYTHVIQSQDIDRILLPMIENLTGRKITPVQHRKSQQILCTNSQRFMIEKIMQEDYINGWV